MPVSEFLYGTLVVSGYNPDGSRYSYNEYRNLASAISDSKPDPVKSRKPSGWLYPKPYQREIHLSANCRGVIREYRKSDNSSVVQDGVLGNSWGMGSSPALPSSSSNLRRSAEIKALVGLKKQRVNLSVALREAQMTADYLGTLGLRAAQFYKALRKRTMPKWNGLEAPSSSMTKAILEQQYALAPLLSDVYGAAQALRERNSVRDWVVTTKGAIRSKSTDEEFILFDGSTLRARLTRGSELGYFVRLDYTPANEFLSTLSSLGMTNPLEVIWEAVPYSFVVDWAIPIGEWLSAMDATLGYKFLSGSCSELKKSHHRVRSEGQDTPSHHVVSDFAGRGRSFSLTRTVYDASPIPAAPRIKNPLSLGHMRNGLALMYQALFGRR